MRNNLPELLAPAGDKEALLAALRFGADAVYIGGPQMQLRAKKAGFSMGDVAWASARAHERGKRLYVTVNAFCDNDDIDALPDYARALCDADVDAVIVSDLGAIQTIQRAAPQLDVHVSTQANCLNYAAASVYQDMGAKRVVLGREMTLEQIAALHDRLPDMELEVFVHGAMCMAYSGRCMLSAALTGRSANKGACAQSCRWTYHLVEEKRPGQFFPVEEDEGGMAILSSRDLCAMPLIDELIQAGVSSFKIEGRMKTPYYVATVVNAYRHKLDSCDDMDALMGELNAVSHRPYSTGFFFDELRRAGGDAGAYLSDCLFVGNVLSDTKDGAAKIRLRNKFAVGDALEVVTPDRLGVRFIVEDILDEERNAVRAASVPDREYMIRGEADLHEGDYLRLRTNERSVTAT